MSIFKEYKASSKVNSLRVGDSCVLQVDECYRKAMRAAKSEACRSNIKITTELLKAINKENKVIELISIKRIA